MGAAEQVRNIIMDIPQNQIIAASDLKRNMLSDVTDACFYKTLERMTQQGSLVHLTKGLYYRPMLENNSLIPMKEETIVDYYISDSAGTMIGEGLYVERGISRGLEKRMVFISNRLTEAKKHVASIEVHGTDMQLDDSTIASIQMLELLQNYNKVSDVDKYKFVDVLHDFAEEYSDEATAYVLRNRKYKKSTIAFLARILDWYGISHSLREHLSTLSNYKIPCIDELKLEIPEHVVSVLDHYVQGIRAICKGELERVILYGSYAKGNYGSNSDIDIMILVKKDEKELYQENDAISDLTYDFNIEYELDIKPVVQSADTFSKWVGVYPFYKNISAEGVILHGV